MKNVTLIACMIMLMLVLGAGTAVAATYTFGDSTYWVVQSSGISWESARVAAENAGGHLATITSVAENSFVQQNVLSSQVGEFWLGASQTGDSDLTSPLSGWQWVTGEDWGFTDWQSTEPNNYGGLDEQHLATWSRFDWQWNDEGYLNNIAGFVVEQPVSPPVPVPTSLWLLGAGVMSVIGFRRYV